MRVFGLLKVLAAHFGELGWVVDVLSVAPLSDPDETVRAFTRSTGIEARVVRNDLRLGRNRPARAARWAHSSLSAVPSWILERSPRELRTSLECTSSDILIFFGEAAARYAAAAPRSGLRVWDRSNIIGRSARDTWTGRPVRSRLSASAAQSYERRRLPLFDKIVVTSDAEAARLAELYGRRADAVVASGVVPAQKVAWRAGKVLGWLGSFQYSSNTDGLARFLRDDWPPLQRAGWRLEVAGVGTPPARLQRMLDAEGINMRGFVRDLIPWMASINAAVVPIYSGGGVKLKTLTWMAAGIPVVGTPEAFEGIPVVHNESGLIAGMAPGAFLTECSRLISMPAREQKRLCDRARRIVLTDFDIDALGTKYARYLEIWHSSRFKHA